MTKTSEAYKYIYHYTTEEGLRGILASQSLWATNVKHLNDASELVHFKNIAPSLIVDDVFAVYQKLAKTYKDAAEHMRRFGGTRQVAEYDSIKMIDAMYIATGDEFFVTSFCGQHEDDYINQNGFLSQWRGYGNDQGIMIEFETEPLEKLLELESTSFAYDALHLSDVVYSSDQNALHAELSDAISAVADFSGGLLAHQLLKTKEPDGGKAMSGFVQCITRYKHCGFKEEREVRIAAWVRDAQKQEEMEKLGSERATLKPVRERERNTKKVPYVELFGQKDMRLPIKKIVVGPHAKKEEVAKQLKEQLKSTGIEVTVSDIPYINLYATD